VRKYPWLKHAPFPHILPKESGCFFVREVDNFVGPWTEEETSEELQHVPKTDQAEASSEREYQEFMAGLQAAHKAEKERVARDHQRRIEHRQREEQALQAQKLEEQKHREEQRAENERLAKER
jgi:hypothetical protein